MCANLWIGLINIRGSRKTNNRENVRPRLSLKRGGISGQTDTVITDQWETSLGSPGLPILRQLMLCSENRCAMCWRRLKTRCSSNGQIRWQEISWGAIRAFIAITTRIRDTPPKTAGTCGITWTSWSERGNSSSSYTTPTAKGAR